MMRAQRWLAGHISIQCSFNLGRRRERGATGEGRGEGQEEYLAIKREEKARYIQQCYVYTSWYFLQQKLLK